MAACLRAALTVKCKWFCVCSRFVRSLVVEEEEEEEDSEETQPSKPHAVNGNATNGLLEEGSPSECTAPPPHTPTCSSQILVTVLAFSKCLFVPQSICN